MLLPTCLASPPKACRGLTNLANGLYNWGARASLRLPRRDQLTQDEPMGKSIDQTGRRYGKLLVLEKAKDYFTPGGARKVKWRCQCDCGNVLEVRGSSLSTGNTKSCGCLHAALCAARATVHGMKHSPEYNAWSLMKARCFRPTADNYAHYGGRGITVAVEWLDFTTFFRDMGPKPSPNHSLDRIDVNGHYCVENCRWATRIEQMRNKRTTLSVTYNGQRMSLAAAAELAGIKLATVHARRRKGWPEDRLLEPAAPWPRAAANLLGTTAQALATTA